EESRNGSSTIEVQSEKVLAIVLLVGDPEELLESALKFDGIGNVRREPSVHESVLVDAGYALVLQHPTSVVLVDRAELHVLSRTTELQAVDASSVLVRALAQHRRADNVLAQLVDLVREGPCQPFPEPRGECFFALDQVFPLPHAFGSEPVVSTCGHARSIAPTTDSDMEPSPVAGSSAWCLASLMRKSQVNDPAALEALGLRTLSAQEGKGEVDALDLALPALGDRPLATLDQVLLQFVETGQHLGVDVQHRAADAGVFVCAGRPVGPAAGPQLDPALVEVLLEVVPLLGAGLAVLVLGPLGPAPGEELLVLADHVLVEHRDVAAGGADVEVAGQGGADVDGQAVVHEFGGEQPAEVVGCELHPLELRVRDGKSVAGPLDHAPDGGGGHAALDAAVEGLKQVGQLFAPDLFVQVVAGADGNGAVLVAVAPDDLRDDVEQLRRHGDDPFPVALGRGGGLLGHVFAAGALVLPDADVGRLGQFLGPQAGLSLCLHAGPLLDGDVLVPGKVDESAGGPVHGPDRRAVVPLVLGRDPQPGGAVGGELIAVFNLLGGFEHGPQAVPGVIDVLGQDRQERLTVAG